MRTYEQQMDDLKDGQREAAKIDFNAVVAAGAGSGKTKVLASRFLHLVVERNIPVNEILALTFTRKAAAEMRSRIYSMLKETESKEAQAAAAAFYSAQIQTLDSFCASICRAACRAYGVSPDFTVDNEGIAERARQAALVFILQHKDSPAIASMLKRFSIEDIASSFFAAAIKEHSSISSPLDFKGKLDAQKERVREELAAVASSLKSKADELREKAAIKEKNGNLNQTWKNLISALAAGFAAPNPADKESVAAFVISCSGVSRVNLNNTLKEIKGTLLDFRKDTARLVPIANFILNEKIIDEAFSLLDEFQSVFNEIKRAEGVLTFSDISRMAVDSLQGDDALRRFYKGAFKSIMIDEFQDNNELQKDLLYLISGESEAGGVPKAESLEKNRLFFVGDEKQSIYLFRGADVSVFRRLNEELKRDKPMPQLLVNFRTEEKLLDIFNRLFPHVFCPLSEERGREDYEAEFSPSRAHVSTKGCAPGLAILLLAKERFDSKNKKIASKTDTEAELVALQIKRLVEKERYKIRDKAAPSGESASRPCKYSDIAILFRSTGKQHRFEQKLREQEIPYTSESLTGLFTDAPANDIYSLLRLAVNPEDTFSYAVVLRSPFVAVGDEAFTRIMAERAKAAENKRAPNAPFSDDDAALVAGKAAEKFRKAAEAYSFVRDSADKIPVARIVSSLWYKFGYRCVLLSDPALAHYSEIYDYFFEVARQADAKAISLSDFLDSLDEKRKGKARFDEVDIPAGKGDGVRLMTVHKSKGLEFPIVFIVDAANSGKAESNAKPFYFSSEYAITINTEAPRELKELKENKENKGEATNFFYMEAKEENARKDAAETKRLLYVAMTRAESKVFVSGSVNLGGKDSESGKVPELPRSEEEIMELLSKKFAGGKAEEENKSAEGKKETSRLSFLDLLLPALVKASKEAGGLLEGVSVRESLPSPAQQKKLKAESAPANLLEGVKCASYAPSLRSHFAASKLYDAKKALRGEAGQAGGDVERAKSGLDDEVDIVLKKSGITPADFGTYVHAAIEEGFTGHPSNIPQEAREAAFRLASRFFDSDIGKAAKAASWRQTEYGFRLKTDVEGLGSCVVSGKMDLVFEDGGTLFVVDYKTDKTENPALYKEQMQAYKKAAEGLFAAQFPAAKVECFLFYVRSGKAIQC